MYVVAHIIISHSLFIFFCLFSLLTLSVCHILSSTRLLSLYFSFSSLNSIHTVLSAFSPEAHPAVASKRVSVTEIHDSFILDLYRISQFETHGSVFDVFAHYLESDLIADVNCGDMTFNVTSPVFYKLYEAYSQGIQNDGYFERLLSRTWHSLGLSLRSKNGSTGGVGSNSTATAAAAAAKKKNFLTSSYCRRLSSFTLNNLE